MRNAGILPCKGGNSALGCSLLSVVCLAEYARFWNFGDMAGYLYLVILEEFWTFQYIADTFKI